MLKQRVITAIVLAIVVLAALTARDPIYWRLTISVVLLVAFWEWLRFCQISELPLQALSFTFFIALFACLQMQLIPVLVLVSITCLAWLVCLYFTLADKFAVIHRPIVKLLLGVWLLSAAGHLIIEFKYLSNGLYWILCCLVAIFAADIGAYFTGKRFGKTKLAPSISPGKTVEGLLGGLLFVLVIYTPVFFWYFSPIEALLLLLTVMITAFLSVGGDLFESKLKRHVNLKDSSQILPGHGGILDRIDSLLVGVPFFVFGLLLFGFIS